MYYYYYYLIKLIHGMICIPENYFLFTEYFGTKKIKQPIAYRFENKVYFN